MLTKEAFNALLKTLEEPPAHVIFILATTEEEKLLDTILSRCQVFRFRSPSRSVLAETVIDIARLEGFKLARDAADLIALSADGSFRDALGITQKVIMASGDQLGNADEVAAIIGAPRSQLLADILLALQLKDTNAALRALKQAVDSRVDMKLFARLLLEQLRAVILLRYTSDEEEILVPFSEVVRETIKKIVPDSQSQINSHLLARFLSAAQEVNRSPLHHLPLELAIIEVTTTNG